MTESKDRSRAARERDRQVAPKRVDNQDAPEPERPTTPLEDAGQSIQDLREPPQAEGDR